MSNTYGSYLEEEQKKAAQASAAPAVQSETPVVAAAPTSVRTADGYSKFLETLANNKKIENTPTNAKTYADYLTYTGRDPVGDYQAKVRQANLDYAKAMSTYGQNAEKLAKSGLSGSGYGEYLTGLAYAGKQSAVAGAQKDAKAALDQSFSSYGDYIESLKNTNEQAAMTGILNQMLEGDAAKEYARSLGVTEDRLEYVLSQTSASVSAAKAQKAQEAQALLANATAAVTELTANDQTLDAAIESLRGVYDKDTLDKVKENLQNATNAQFDASIKGATGVANYNDELKKQLASGAITTDQYNAQVVAGQNKNYEFVQKFVDSNDASGLSEYAKANGLDISGGTTEEVDAVVDHMAANGYITKEQQQKYYADSWANTIADTDYNSKQAVNTIENMGNQLASGKLSQDKYDEIVAALTSKLLGTGNEVKYQTASNWKGLSAYAYNLCVDYEQGSYGDESIDLEHKVDEPVTTGTYKEAMKLEGSISGGDPVSSIGVINGKIAVRYANGKVFYADYLHSEDNAMFIAWVYANAK